MRSSKKPSRAAAIPTSMCQLLPDVMHARVPCRRVMRAASQRATAAR
jgi:hypothetical protein